MARTPFKLKSQGSSFKMMGSSSPTKRTGKWITLPDGTITQVGGQDIIEHEKAVDEALFQASEVGRDFAVANPERTSPEAFEQSEKGKKIIAEREAAVTALGEASTTGKESMERLKNLMSTKDKKKYAGVMDEDCRREYPERAKDWDIAQKEALEEEASGVAATQKELDAAALAKAKAKAKAKA